MKKFFLSMVAVMVATLSYAQNTLVATLTHGDEISMFYGTYALRDAYNASVSGDIINLSGGSFQANNLTITKGISLRGTGIDDVTPSIITGSFTINIPADDANRFSMEGIRCKERIYMNGSFKNPLFNKCAINYFSYSESSSIKNALCTNCLIIQGIYLVGNSSVQFINSFINYFQNKSETTASAAFVNCVISPQTGYADTNNDPNNIKNSQLINCIIFATSPYNFSLPQSSIATNCIGVNFTKLFNNSQTNIECGYNTFAYVFKDFNGTYSDEQTFELTDEAKAGLLGTDGTEIGMYGGILPYTSTPSYPQITKMNVANKTTADGKLSVEIEVSAAE